MALLDWFGPSRTEVWRKLSAQLGGAYTPKTWLRSDRIDVQHEHWIVTLDTYTVHANNTHVPYTRLRAPFRDREGFRCKVSRTGVFSFLGKWLGLQDVQVGDEAFDRAFVVKANDERKVQALLASAELRRLLAAQKAITLSVEDHEGWFGPKFPADCDELRAVVRGHVKDLERLRQLFALFAIALDQLCAIGAAYADAPSLKL
jgi:hypothetical protein